VLRQGGQGASGMDLKSAGLVLDSSFHAGKVGLAAKSVKGPIKLRQERHPTMRDSHDHPRYPPKLRRSGIVLHVRPRSAGSLKKAENWSVSLPFRYRFATDFRPRVDWAIDEQRRCGDKGSCREVRGPCASVLPGTFAAWYESAENGHARLRCVPSPLG
jgi:hypothetical protein